jgi:prepilin-type processing-associated H-X9-DG protein
MATCRNYRYTNRFRNMSGGTYPFELMPPTSEHRGGVNMLFLDGCVRFVNETVDRGP